MIQTLYLIPINIKFLKLAENIVWTGDGSEISNTKITAAYSALMMQEDNEENPLYSHIVSYI